MSRVGVLVQDDFTPRGLEAAAERLRRKAALTASQFDRLADEHKRRAFALAEINNAKVIQRLRDLVIRAKRDGIPYRDVRREMVRMLRAAGLESPPLHRLRFLYQHHAMTSMARAQTEHLKQKHVKRAFPYWQYKVVTSPGHRATHEAFRDIVLPVGDPFWRYHTPPWEPG